MRIVAIAAAALLIASPALAQQHHPDSHRKDGPASMHAGMAPIAEGWNVRVDRDAAAEGIMFHSMPDHMHVRTGPGGVFYNPTWTHAGDYAVSARFRQNRAPTHPEAYGIAIGGTELDGPGQTYSYFLVRGAGEYFIATRRGAERTIVSPWTRHEAIATQDAGSGVQLNVLSVAPRGDQVVFSVNGTEVASHPRSAIVTDGVAGFRINHNLDVRIDQIQR